MKKGIILTLTFLIVLSISILVQSYLGGGIKLSTVEMSNPKLTYFVENIKHNLGLKLIVSLIISTVVTAIIGLLYSHKKTRV